MSIKEIIFMVEEAPEGGYTARVLGYSIFTEAETLEELKEGSMVMKLLGRQEVIAG